MKMFILILSLFLSRSLSLCVCVCVCVFMLIRRTEIRCRMGNQLMKRKTCQNLNYYIYTKVAPFCNWY